MTETIASTQLLPSQIIERRRPGRVDYANPHLIALFRYSGAAASRPVDGPAGIDDADELGLDFNEATLLSGTISLFDGACQVGSPDLVINLEQKSELARCSADEFLADQACYIADARIATANGVMTVKDLAAGDVILTPSGDRTVIWARPFSLNPASEPRPELAAPVFIRRHAIAPELPGEDLWTSAAHCLAIENHLIPARLLVNGMTVVQDLARTSVQYCQVLFDRPARERSILGADDATPVRRRLAERAVRLGYDRAYPGGTADIGLHLLVDGRPILPVEITGARHAFVVPPGCQVVQVAAGYDAPVVKIETITQTDYDVTPADHPGLLLGWGAFQREGDVIWRCVIGLARLPACTTKHGATVVVYLKASRYGAPGL